MSKYSLKWYGIWLSVIIFTAFLIWIIAIDKIAFFERCTQCGNSHYIVKYRFFGLTVSEYQHTIIETFTFQLSKDLGVPCSHSYQRREKARCLGLLIPVIISEDEDFSLIRDDIPDWYDNATSQMVKSFQHIYPQTASELYKRVQQEKDYIFIQQFCEQLKNKTLNNQHQLE